MESSLVDRVAGLVPPLAVVLARRYRLVRRLSFWLPAVVVTAILKLRDVMTLEHTARRQGNLVPTA